MSPYFENQHPSRGFQVAAATRDKHLQQQVQHRLLPRLCVCTFLSVGKWGRHIVKRFFFYKAISLLMKGHWKCCLISATTSPVSGTRRICLQGGPKPAAISAVAKLVEPLHAHLSQKQFLDRLYESIFSVLLKLSDVRGPLIKIKKSPLKSLLNSNLHWLTRWGTTFW